MATTTRFVDTDGRPVEPGEYTITDTRVHVTAITRPNGFTIDRQDATIVHTVTPTVATSPTGTTAGESLVTDEQVAAAVSQAYRDGASQEDGSWSPPARARIRDYPDRDAEAEQINHAAMRRILEAAARVTPATTSSTERTS